MIRAYLRPSMHRLLDKGSEGFHVEIDNVRVLLRIGESVVRDLGGKLGASRACHKSNNYLWSMSWLGRRSVRECGPVSAL